MFDIMLLAHVKHTGNEYGCSKLVQVSGDQ